MKSDFWEIVYFNGRFRLEFSNFNSKKSFNLCAKQSNSSVPQTEKNRENFKNHFSFSTEVFLENLMERKFYGDLRR